jgi:hypothetical protein
MSLTRTARQCLNYAKESKPEGLVASTGIHIHTFSLLHIIQTDYGIHPALYSMYTAVLSRG